MSPPRSMPSSSLATTVLTPIESPIRYFLSDNLTQQVCCSTKPVQRRRSAFKQAGDLVEGRRGYRRMTRIHDKDLAEIGPVQEGRPIHRALPFDAGFDE